MQPTNEEIAGKAALVNNLIAGFSEQRRVLIERMFNGPVGASFYTAPASSREEFHSCYPGGLMIHSLNVVKNLKVITQALCPGTFSNETIAFVGLFHDLGKTGDGVHDFYVPHPNDWHRKQGHLYEVNKECLNMPNSERGLFIFQNHGVTLSSDEYLSIRLNDGMYAEENRVYGIDVPQLALLTHWADIWACKSEKAPSQ